MTTPRPLPATDPRLSVPLYTTREVGRFIDVPTSTIRNWTRGYQYPVRGGSSSTRPIVASTETERTGYPSIPFLGLAEALVLKSFRERKLSMVKIRAALMALDREMGIANVLANKALYTDGAQVLWDYAKERDDSEIKQLVEPGSGQKVFVEVVRRYLQLITYDSDLWAERIELPAYQPTQVVVDMRRGFGRPILEESRIRIEEIVERFAFGNESIQAIADDLELNLEDVENVIRAATRPAAA
jgi:uncharacterized protein (DUF433 family)